MTINQALALQPSTRVSYGLSLTPSGSVIKTQCKGVKVRWDDHREVLYPLSHVHLLHVPAAAVA